MSITATERTQIVTLTTLMFNAAPGATYLTQIVSLYEANGHNLATLASQLAQTSVYQSMNPSFQTSAEFAASFLTPLGLAGDTFAVNFITSQLNAGASKAQVVYAAYQALANLDPNASAQYQAAKAIMTNKGTVAEYYSATLLGAATDLTTLQTVVGSVTADPATVASSEAALQNLVTTTFDLTAGVDSINGTAGNDIINGVTGGANPTFGALDSINGGTGTNNQLNISDVGTGGTFTIPAGATIQNIQTFSVNSAENVGNTATPTTFNAAGIAGLTTLNVTDIGGSNIKASATTNVNLSDTTTGVAGTGAVEVTGGNNVSITATPSGGAGTGGAVIADGTAGALTITQNSGGAITVGATTAVAGSVTINDTNLQTSNIGVDGGTNIGIVATTKATFTGTTGSITIGATTKPTGAVTLTENLNGTGAATGGIMTVNGGTTDNITVNMTQATGGSTTTAGAVNVNGSSATTSVSVTETAAVAPVTAVTAVAGVTETGSAVFTALTAGQTLIVGGLTFTAGAAGTTAAQTAAAFANLTAGALQGNSTLGTYSGQVSGWTSGPVSGTATVVFTSTTANTNVADLAFTGTGTAPTITETQGSAATKAVAGVGGIADGVVTIVDAKYGTGTNTIASVALNGYATGSAVSSDALTSLSLANALDAAVTVKDNTATALGLTVNNVTATTPGALSTLNLDAGVVKYTTLNVTTAGADSALAITGAGVTALTIGGTNAIDLTGSTLSALKTVVVSGAAGATLASVASVTDINASATSGNMTVTAFDATKATYEGGSGVDKLTLSTANPTKAVSLGAGNDTLTLAGGTTAPTATLDGGAGTDTLSMAGADAATASATSAFATKVVNFEHLTVTGAGTNVIDLAALGNYSFVTDTGASTDTFNNMASGGTLVFTATGASDTVAVTNAATGTADSLNVVLQAAGALSDNVTAANVESVAITANDTTKGVAAGATNDFSVVTDSALTSATVLGNATLNLTLTSTKVSTVDASGMTGGLVYTTTGTVAETVKGGASANTLTAHSGSVADTLIGGAGNDTITANAGLDTLTGGGGNDTFVITTPSANVNSYATITDANAGDTIKLSTTGTITFAQSKVTLASTAVFQDYANAVIAGTAQGNIAWFQYGGDTYVVQHEQAGGTAFLNGTDLIVKLAGLVDLSHTSLNTTSATLLIG